MIADPSVYIVCKEYLTLLEKICGNVSVGNFLDDFEYKSNRLFFKLSYKEITEFLKIQPTHRLRRIRILFPFPRNSHEIFLEEETWVSYLNVMLDLVKQSDGLFVTGCDWDEYDLVNQRNRNIISIVLGMLRFKGIGVSKLVWLYGNVKTAIDIEKSLMPNEKPILLYYAWWVRMWKTSTDIEDEQLDLNFNFKSPHSNDTEYTKKFLLLNRKIRPHRTAITLWMYDNVLQKYAHLSYVKNITELTDPISEWNYTKRLYRALEKEKYDLFMSSPPLMLDNTDSNDCFENLPIHYWKSSLIYLITERYYFEYEQAEGFITEKTIKAFLNNIMFIMIGKYKNLEYLRYIGFKTCDFLIDESYDQIKCDEKRMEAIFKEVKRLSTISMSDLIYERGKNYQEVLYHNKKLLSSFTNQNIPEMIDSLELYNLLYK